MPTLGCIPIYYTTIQQNQLVIDKNYKEDDIKGTLKTENDDQLIMTTIPYDEGWNVYVDGKRVETFEISNALVGFRIDEAGEHSVRFLYRSKAFTAGIIISVVSIALFVLIVVLENKIKRLAFVRAFFPSINSPEQHDDNQSKLDSSKNIRKIKK